MEAENHSNCDIAVAAAVKGFFQTNGFEWAAFVGWTRRVKFCICSDISTSGSDNEQLRMCFGLPIILSTWSKCDASNYLAKGKIVAFTRSHIVRWNAVVILPRLNCVM